MNYLKLSLISVGLAIATSSNAAIVIDVTDNGGMAQFDLSGLDTVAVAGSTNNGFWLNDLLEAGAVSSTQGRIGQTYFTGTADYVINSTNYAINDIWYNGTDNDYEMGFRSSGNPFDLEVGDVVGLSGSIVSTLNYSLFNEGSYNFSSVGPYSSSEAVLTDGITFNVGPVSAVPEPSTYALMLGGLGLVGFMAARRRKA